MTDILHKVDESEISAAYEREVPITLIPIRYDREKHLKSIKMTCSNKHDHYIILAKYTESCKYGTFRYFYQSDSFCAPTDDAYLIGYEKKLLLILTNTVYSEEDSLPYDLDYLRAKKNLEVRIEEIRKTVDDSEPDIIITRYIIIDKRLNIPLIKINQCQNIQTLKDRYNPELAEFFKNAEKYYSISDDWPLH